MRFSQHYSGAPVCAPSRSTLLTGLHTGHTPIRGNFEIQPEGQYPMPDTLMTLGKIFQQAGYRTAAFGKFNTPNVLAILPGKILNARIHNRNQAQTFK
jgi:arylsulfatase A-like enzyme